MSVKDLTAQQHKYIAGIGGYLELLESDGVNNDLNREVIKTFANEHGTSCYLGNINFYGVARRALTEGKISCYEKYAGKEVLNFEYSFIVPVRDHDLEDMIRQWNSDGYSGKDTGFSGKIVQRIYKLGGLTFIWS